MFIPDPVSDFFPSRIPYQNFSIPNPKKLFFKLSEIWSRLFVPDPGSGSWFLPIPDPRYRGQKGTGSTDPNPQQWKYAIKIINFLASWRSLTKITGSGSGSESVSDKKWTEDPHTYQYQNFTDPIHCEYGERSECGSGTWSENGSTVGYNDFDIFDSNTKLKIQIFTWRNQVPENRVESQHFSFGALCLGLRA